MAGSVISLLVGAQMLLGKPSAGAAIPCCQPIASTRQLMVVVDQVTVAVCSSHFAAYGCDGPGHCAMGYLASDCLVLTALS